MRQIDLSKNAKNYLTKIPLKHAKQILSKIQSLAEDEKSVSFELMVGYFPYHRLKSGEYRVIFKFTDETITIETIGKRNDDDVYKEFKRGF
jgi:mRNA interferase RelE/StbE